MTAADDVAALFPCTERVLSDVFARALERARESVPRQPDARGGADAVLRGVTEVLLAACAREPDVPAFAADVVAYEAALAALAASDGAAADARAFAEHNATLVPPGAGDLALVFPVTGKHVRVERFGCDVAALAEAIESCDRIEPLLSGGPCAVLFAVSDRARAVRRFRIGESVRALVEACDGTRDAAAIAAAAGEPAEAVLAALEALRAHDIVTYREGAR